MGLRNRLLAFGVGDVWHGVAVTYEPQLCDGDGDRDREPRPGLRSGP